MPAVVIDAWINTVMASGWQPLFKLSPSDALAGNYTLSANGLSFTEDCPPPAGLGFDSDYAILAKKLANLPGIYTEPLHSYLEAIRELTTLSNADDFKNILDSPTFTAGWTLAQAQDPEYFAQWRDLLQKMMAMIATKSL